MSSREKWWQGLKAKATANVQIFSKCVFKCIGSHSHGQGSGDRVMHNSSRALFSQKALTQKFWSRDGLFSKINGRDTFFEDSKKNKQQAWKVRCDLMSKVVE